MILEGGRTHELSLCGGERRRQRHLYTTLGSELNVHVTGGAKGAPQPLGGARGPLSPLATEGQTEVGFLVQYQGRRRACHVPG